MGVRRVEGIGVLLEMLGMGGIIRRRLSIRELLSDERLSWSTIRSRRARSTARSRSSIQFHLSRSIDLLILRIPLHLLLAQHAGFGDRDLSSGEVVSSIRISNLQRISTSRTLRRLRRMIRLSRELIRSTIRRTRRSRRIEPRRLPTDITVRTSFLLLRPTRSLPRSRRRIFDSSFRICRRHPRRRRSVPTTLPTPTSRRWRRSREGGRRSLRLLLRRLWDSLRCGEG